MIIKIHIAPKEYSRLLSYLFQHFPTTKYTRTGKTLAAVVVIIFQLDNLPHVKNRSVTTSTTVTIRLYSTKGITARQSQFRSCYLLVLHIQTVESIMIKHHLNTQSRPEIYMATKEQKKKKRKSEKKYFTLI